MKQFNTVLFKHKLMVCLHFQLILTWNFDNKLSVGWMYQLHCVHDDFGFVRVRPNEIQYYALCISFAAMGCGVDVDAD